MTKSTPGGTSPGSNVETPTRASAPVALSTATADSRDLALAVAKAGLDKKAAGVEIVDVSGKVDYADFLVLMTGRSDRHVHAVARGVEKDLREKRGEVPLSVEGMTAGVWVLLDFNDVVVHVFQEDSRLFYDLEGLWIDASRVSIPNPPDRRGGAN